MAYFKKKGDMKETFERCEKETVEDVLKLGFHAAKDRGIRKNVCEKFGIRSALSEKDGETIEAFYFPSYNQKGKIVGFMKQDITKDKEERGHWKAIGSVNISNKMFGQDIAEIPGPADGHGAQGQGVFQNQIPADDPGPKFT